ncbi:N-acetylmuramoyl-L-alanine amidase [Williamsia sp. CHRR-6]|uniref:N-acetylmuramoyl-L-alanine amidase n=1 Tax=Williamsia sp. CHRR-6 TaxID=2835871 RepID=UPI0027DC7075|nr:N-acetylmuramoyl-L-alanine amidase [Williamsia sp. CHRR-6]
MAVTSPLAVHVLGTSPDNTVEHRSPAATAGIPTSIDQIRLDSVPSMVLDVVRSGLAAVGVTLPPIDLTTFNLDDVGRLLPPGVLPDGILPARAPDTQGPQPAPTDPRRPVSAQIPAGAVVKEITRPDPFSMIALTWKDISDSAARGVSGTSAVVRARKADGSWGPWINADPSDGGDPARTSGRPNEQTGTEPVWVGDTRAVQVVVTKKGVAAAAPVGSTPAPTVGATTTVPAPPAPKPPVDRAPANNAPERGDPVAPRDYRLPLEPPPVPAGPSAAPAPSPNPLEQVLTTLSAALINPGTASPIAPPPAGAAPVLPGQQPPIITRAQWGADESKRCDQPTYDPVLKGAVVHHTAGNNDYTPEQSAEIVRGIYAYHAQTLGWCDIGYNAIVDKYGQIFEGAFGGLDKNVQGTHTGGFNRETVGVAMLGNYNDIAPTPELIRSVGSFLGWRLRLAGLDPKGTAQLVSQGFDTAKFGAGETSNLPMISGHRDYDNTECPGELGYAALPQIREVAAGNVTAAQPAPPAAGPASPAPAPGTANAGQVLTIGDLGAIAQKWLSLGGPGGILGNALSTEKTVAGSEVKSVDFQNGQIVWSPTTGAQPLLGAIGKAWTSAGAETSSLGLPVSGENTAVDGVITQAFQFGTLVFNRATGVVVQVVKAFIDEFIRSMRGQSAPGAAPAGAPTTAVPVPPAG